MSYLGFLSWLNEQALQKKLVYAKAKPLSALSNFKIGGPADFVVWPLDEESLCTLLITLKEMSMRYEVFGNCSNVLFADEGFRGCIVLMDRIKSIEQCEDENGNVFVTAGAGVSLNALASYALQNSLTGIEFAYGIPGSVGGAVYMNAGAYEHSVSEVIVKSTFVDRNGETGTLAGDEHMFGYRRSAYMKNSAIVTTATFMLKKGDPAQIKATMDDLMSRRREKQPLEYPSAGSVFKRYPGYFTAKLIDDAGLKGYSVGGAQVSVKHAGFIINKNNATANDVKQLIDIIKQKIHSIYGIDIECEVIIMDP